MLDDFSFERIPAVQQLLGGQYELVLSDKYMKKKTITWGRPSIILTNNTIFLENASEWMRDWLDKNIEIFNVTEPFFTDVTQDVMDYVPSNQQELDLYSLK